MSYSKTNDDDDDGDDDDDDDDDGFRRLAFGRGWLLVIVLLTLL